MRSLIYVPIIHQAADLGSVSAVADEKGNDLLGRKEWEKHKEIVRSYWEQISDYFSRIDAAGLHIFQDGLPVGGDMALRIIREGAERGSRNYRIILDMVNRGGIINKTEDVELLKRELMRAQQLTHQNPLEEEETDVFQNLISGERLMADRDRFTARSINEILKQRGVLFMGALHRVPSYLENDITVLELKKIEKVQAYLKVLYAEGAGKLLTSLSAYMVAPIQP